VPAEELIRSNVQSPFRGAAEQDVCSCSARRKYWCGSNDVMTN